MIDPATKYCCRAPSFSALFAEKGGILSHCLFAESILSAWLCVASATWFSSFVFALRTSAAAALMLQVAVVLTFA
jgi:hypothetical protein